jgi:hypothetical protein
MSVELGFFVWRGYSTWHTLSLEPRQRMQDYPLPPSPDSLGDDVSACLVPTFTVSQWYRAHI